MLLLLLLPLELKLGTKEGTANERTHLHIFTEFIKRNWRTNQWNYRWEKMRKKTEGNKWKVTIKRLVWEFNIGNLCVLTKIIKRTYLLPPSTSVTVILIAEKLLSLWLWIFLKFLTLNWFFLTFCEKLCVIAWEDYFVLQICWRWVDLINSNPLQTKTKYNIPMINVKTKVFWWKWH